MTSSASAPTAADAPSASDERARREALRRYDILDTTPEEAFDRIVTLAAHLFDVPTALISFPAGDRPWLKACVGFDADATDLEASFCTHTLKGDGVVVVEDAAQDPRFADHALVGGDNGIRFYAGAPITTSDGHAIGTLCVLDTEVRSPSDATCAQLGTLAAMVMDELELRREAARRARIEGQIGRIVEHAQPIVFMTDPEGTLVLAEGRDLEALGLAPGDAVGRSVYAMFGDAPCVREDVRRALSGEPVESTVDADGHTFDIWYAPYHDASGAVAGCIGMALDITERRAAQDALQKNQALLRQTQQLAKVGGWAYNADTESLFWTDEVYRILELPEGAEIDPETAISFYAPEARDTVRTAVRRALATGAPFDLELPLHLGNDARKWVRAISDVQQKNGEVVQLTGAVQDITDRKEAEREREKTNQRLRLALEAADAGTFEFDVAADRNDWDARTCEIFGLDDETPPLSTRAFFELVHPDDRDALANTFRHALAGENRYDVSYRIQRPDGEVRHVQSSGIVERDSRGEPTRVIGLTRDVTNQKRSEGALRRSRERWQRLVNAHRDPILITADGLIRYINPAGAHLFGADVPKDLLGNSVLDFLVDAQARKMMRRRQERLKRGEPTAPLEYDILRLDGERRTIEVYSMPIEYEGEAAAQTVAHDITERKRDERALRESKAALEEERQRLDMALTGGTLGLWDLDFTTGRNLVDERWAEMLGYALDEIEPTLEFFESLVHPDDRHKPYDALERHTRGETDVMSVDIRMRAKGGAWRWIRDKGKVMEWTDDGEPKRAVGTHQDITEEREQQEALRRSRQKYKSLFDASNDAIFIHTLGGEILDANVQAKVLFDYYDRDALLGQDVANLVAPDANALHRSLDLLREEEMSSIHVEEEFVRSDGSTFWGEISATRFEVDDETVVQSMLRDVTERKAAEEALRESEARFRAVFEGAAPGIAILDRERHLLDVNPSLERILERDADGLRGEPLDAFVHSSDLGADRAAFNALVQRERRSYQTEQRYLTPDSSAVWVQLSMSRLPLHDASSDEALRLVAFVVDVTERKQLEAQLRRAQKMETVGTLAGGIAHDFNNILHAAMVYIKMACDDLPEDSSSHTLLTHAQQGLSRSEELVDKLLTFSRQEGKTVEERVDLSDVVRETMDLIAPSLSDALSLRTDLEANCIVQGDPGQLHQVAVNLMTNAVQAMEAHDGRTSCVLDVDVRRTDIDDDLADRYLTLDPGRYVCLSISDTGPGMDADTKERIFEPFFTTKEVGKGTGLGLSVVHGIVQAHDGEITVFTEPGKGSTFNVYIPCANDEAAPSDAPDAASSGHILFVDDDAQVIELEAIRLRRLGYKVTTRQSSRAALDALSATPHAYDLVLTDYAMPEMTGLDLATSVRENGLDLPIVLMSGFSAQVSEADVKAAGVQHFLRKPVGSGELKTALQDFL